MKIVAIIAEYNPPHMGHQYQINKAKEKFGKDCFIIVLMSGNFCQRGYPSFFEEQTKAELAIKLGADLVLALPTITTLSSANNFARGAIKILLSLNCELSLVFGAECADLNYLKIYAFLENILENDELCQAEIRKNLKDGLAYAKASSLAFCNNIKRIAYDNLASLDNLDLVDFNFANLNKCLNEYEKNRSKSNNILGIEYIKAIYELDKENFSPISNKKKNKISTFVIKRQGQEYNETSLVEAFASASAIRLYLENILSQNNYPRYSENSSALLYDTYLLTNLPSFVLARIFYELQNTKKRPSIFPSFLFYNQILQVIESLDLNYLKGLAYWDEALAIRAKKILKTKSRDLKDIDDFVFILASKNKNESRCRRALATVFLGISKEEMKSFNEQEVECIRVLSLSKRGKILLKFLKKSCQADLIFRTGHHFFKCEEAYCRIRLRTLGGDIKSYYEGQYFKSYICTSK